MPKDGSSGRFAKKDSPRPGVSALVSRALALVRLPARAKAQPAKAAVLEEFCTMILANPALTSEQIVTKLRSKGLSDARIVDDYIPVCARAFGEGWVKDNMPFAQVSVGTARLQDLLHHLNDDPPVDQIAPKGFALMIIGALEQHTLGAFVLAHQMRRQGVDIHILTGPTQAEVRDMVLQGGVDVIMFSCAGPASLDSIAETVSSLKATCAQVPPMLLGGAIVDGLDDLVHKTGVDLVLTGQSEMIPLIERLASKRLERQ